MDSEVKRAGNAYSESLVAIVFYVVFAVFTLAPISYDPARYLPDRYDGLLHTWEMAWGVHAIESGEPIWDANIFWPHKDALAYSDHLILQAVFAYPALKISGNPVLAYNCVVFFSFVFCGLGAFLLTRHLTDNGPISLLAGLIYAFCPVRFGQSWHAPQLLFTQFLPFALLFLHKFFERRKYRDAVICGIFFGMHALSSFYSASTGGVAMATVAIAGLWKVADKKSRKLWAGLLIAAGISALFVAPTAAPYYRVSHSQQLERSVKNAEELSAEITDYFSAPPFNVFWGRTKLTGFFQSRRTFFANEHWLFAGVSVLFLAFMAVKKKELRQLHPVRIYMWLAAVAFIFSCGPWLYVFWKKLPIPLPYLVAYYVVPGFKALRVPSRFAGVVELALAILAAYGASVLMKKYSSKFKNAIFAAIMLAVVFEFNNTMSAERIEIGDEVPPVYRWLAAQPGKFAIVELPQLPDFAFINQNLWGMGDPVGHKYMYFSTYHFKNMVNGYSGFLPPTTEHIYRKLMEFPGDESLNAIAYLGVEYIVFHWQNYHWEDVATMSARLREADKKLERVAVFGADIVYRPKSAPITHAAPLSGIVEIADFLTPPFARPGSQFNIEFKISSKYPGTPAYSFGAIPMDASVKMSSRNENASQNKYKEDFIYVDSGKPQNMSFTLDAPESPGDYVYDVTISIGNGGTKDRVVGKITFSQKVGDYPDSLAPGVLKAEILEVDAPKKVKANSKFAISVRIKNTGDTYWRTQKFDGDKNFKGVVMLGIKEWYEEAGKSLNYGTSPLFSPRGFFVESVPPGGEVQTTLRIQTPSKAGKYKIQLQMVDELVVWFDHPENEIYYLVIEVVP